jgi:hypothetical protein
MANHLDVIRLKLTSYFNEFEGYFVVDSIPLEYEVILTFF